MDEWTVWYIDASGMVQMPHFYGKGKAEAFVRDKGLGEQALLMQVVDAVIVEDRAGITNLLEKR